MVVRVKSAQPDQSSRIAGKALCGRLLLAGGFLVSLAACNPDDVKPATSTPVNAKAYGYGETQQTTIFGQGNNLGSFLGLGGGSKSSATPGAIGVGVNSFLWRASLDTISFMPLSSADPFGGVIITDWYSPPATPNERFKINIFILDRELHAAGLRATVFRQTRDASGAWSDAPVDAKTAQNLEDQILTRARQLRVSTAEVEQQKP